MSFTLTSLFRVGEDALQNLFDVQFGSFPLPTGLAFDDFPLTTSFVRVESVSLPEPAVEMYVNHFKTLDIERVSGKMSRPYEFTMTVRLDRQHVLLKLLTLWRNEAIDVTTGEMGDDGKVWGLEGSFRSNVTISPCDNSGNLLIDNAGKVTAWSFYGVFPKSISAPTFDYSSGDKITVDLTFGFIEMKEFLA